jgi:hypothetical protein
MKMHTMDIMGENQNEVGDDGIGNQNGGGLHPYYGMGGGKEDTYPLINPWS